jgi:hypothetical protein
MVLTEETIFLQEVGLIVHSIKEKVLTLLWYRHLFRPWYTNYCWSEVKWY